MQESYPTQDEYQQLLDRLPMGLVVSRNERALFVNQAVAQIVGRPAESVLREGLAAVVYPDDRAAFDRYYAARVRQDGDHEALEFRVVLSPGALRWVKASVLTIVWQGEPGMAVGDREYRRLESRTGAAAGEGERLQRLENTESLEIVMGVVAHDINNILAATLGGVSLAQAVPNSADLPRVWREVEDACLRARELTRRMQAFSLSEPLAPEPTSLDDSIPQWVGAALTGSAVECEYDIADNLWRTCIDRALVAKAVHNVVVNAVEAMSSRGHIEVRVQNREITRTGRRPSHPGATSCFRFATTASALPPKIWRASSRRSFQRSRTGPAWGWLPRWHSSNVTQAPSRSIPP